MSIDSSNGDSLCVVLDAEIKALWIVALSICFYLSKGFLYRLVGRSMCSFSNMGVLH